jgi:hypothetical protein
LSFTGQCAETIQETIGAHYTLKIIKKENGNSVSKDFCAVSQEIFINLFIGMDKEVVHRRGLLRNNLHLCPDQMSLILSSFQMSSYPLKVSYHKKPNYRRNPDTAKQPKAYRITISRAYPAHDCPEKTTKVFRQAGLSLRCHDVT